MGVVFGTEDRMYDVAKIEKLLIIVLLVQKTEKSRQNIGIIMAGIGMHPIFPIWKE